MKIGNRETAELKQTKKNSKKNIKKIINSKKKKKYLKQKCKAAITSVVITFIDEKRSRGAALTAIEFSTVPERNLGAGKRQKEGDGRRLGGNLTSLLTAAQSVTFLHHNTLSQLKRGK